MRTHLGKVRVSMRSSSEQTKSIGTLKRQVIIMRGR